MSTSTPTHEELRQPSVKPALHTALVVFLTVAAIGSVIALALVGIDALNDALARGFASVSSPAG